MTSPAPTELPLVTETQGAVTVLRINRPEKHNALSPETICRLHDALVDFRDDATQRVAVLTGTGTRSFCSGGDLGLTLPLLSGDRAAETDWDRRILADRSIAEKIAFKGLSIDKPVIAAVNGHCLAGGLEMLLGTDIRIASRDALFGLPEAKRGVIPFAGALVRLPRQIPHAHAMQMLLTGEPMDAQAALAAGLVSELLAPEEVMGRAMDLAETIATNAPVSLAEIKRCVHDSSGQPMEAGFAMESRARDSVMATKDAREGPRAFIERRPPVYEGR